jgi:8-oxo-dGTP diphosphatase
MSLIKQIQVLVGIGILVNKDGNVLITQRHDPTHTQVHLRWQLPGGKVEFGETVQEAIVREMKEEVSVDVTLLDHPPIVGSSIWLYPGKKVQCILIGYLCHAHDQKIVIGCEETGDFTWIDPDDIKRYECLPLAREFVLYAKNYFSQDA